MARPRTFDEDRAVEAAMRTFWSTGYEATSTEDLCRATGLGRSSVYNAFGSKHELFEKALLRYFAYVNAGLAEILAEPAPIRDRIRALLRRAVDPLPGDPIGCLVINTIVELDRHDEEITRRIRRHQDERVAMLATAIETAMRAGEIDPAKDARTLAEFVMAALTGIHIATRAGADRATREGIVATALDAL
ncbi:TetR/AcrR family transcriptional regulator [Thermomonospora amylolytica]|uniref:TetR/AcrR family transcriptional regulator n=1 Tax=Thermomonospora amylolytica TaxID=1411117 RepID=UPI000E6C0C16|nr:TetR/AcrR family transcriptional regulator [Thermomonospora amylolytica]